MSDGFHGRLLDQDTLLASAVVANCAMNRQRQLGGANSYTRELGFDPLDVLASQLSGPPTDAQAQPPQVGWLDLCCGTGRALIQAAQRVCRDGLAGRVLLVGVDLVDAFEPVPADCPVELTTAPIETWTPTRRFDLITCVHGLHYVGDKLGVLSRVAGWLTPAGRLIADLDLSSIRLVNGRPAGRRLSVELRAAGFGYDARRHRIGCTGPISVALPYAYLGGDDRAGANYTGQPAVHSYYRRQDDRPRRKHQPVP